VTQIGSGFGFLEETPLAIGKRCYSVNGFSLHCNTMAKLVAGFEDFFMALYDTSDVSQY